MSDTKSNAYDLAAAGMPQDLVYQAYLDQQGLKEAELNYQTFVDRFYKPGGSDITELRANPRKDAAFGLSKILGTLAPASLQDRHRYLDPKKLEAKDYDSFKKGLLANLGAEAGPATRKKYRDILAKEAYEPLFRNLYRQAGEDQDKTHASTSKDSPENSSFDGKRAASLLSQLETELKAVESDAESLEEKSIESLCQILGPLVSPLLRDSKGALDPNKIKAKSLSEFKEFLRTQVSVDGVAFNGFWLDSYQKVLGREEYEPLLKALHQKSLGQKAEAIDDELLRRFTAEIVQVSAERFVRNHLNHRDGRRMLRGILGDSSHYTKEIRSDVVKALASVGEDQGVAGHARYHNLNKNISTWNYFNIAVTDEELDNAARIADGILDGAEYFDTKAEDAARLQKEAPDQVWVLEEVHAGRKIAPEEIEKIQKLIEEKQKKTDPKSQAQVKLAKFWLMTVDNRVWGSGGSMELGVHRGYLFQRAEALLKQTDNMASEAEFLAFNEELQDFLHGELNSEGSETLNWVKDKTVGHGLPEVFERMPDPLKAAYEELRQFSEEIDYARAMGQRFRFTPLPASSGDPQVDEAALQFILGLQQTQRSLWYGYKQHKLLSRAGSQVANVVGAGDIAEIREANEVIDGMIARLERVKSKQDLEQELEFLNEQLKEDGALQQALIAAEMDGFEQLIGLGQTIAVIAAITLATKGAGTSAAVAEAAEAAHAVHWAARASWGLKMGATISLAENGLAIASGEIRPGEDTLLSLAKDSTATGVAMGLFTPFAARLGHSVEQNLLKRLVTRYTEGGLKQGTLRFAGDTVLEAGEELFDAALRGSMDGKPEISFDQFREIGMVTMAGGGTKTGSVVSAFRNSQRSTGAEPLIYLESHPANDNAAPEDSASPLETPNSIAKWAAAAAGVATLLTPDLANAASSIGSADTNQEILPSILAALGLGTLGILGMASQGKQDTKLLQKLDGDILALQLKNPEDPAIIEHWAVIADYLNEGGDLRGEWIQLAIEAKRLPKEGDSDERLEDIEYRIEKIQAQLSRELRYLDEGLSLGFSIPEGFILVLRDGPWRGRSELEEFLNKFSRFNPGFIRILDLRFNKIFDRDITILAASPILSGLTSLNLNGNNLTDSGIKAIADSPFLKNLIWLNLMDNKFGDIGARALAESKGLGNLITLNANANPITDSGHQALRNSPNLTRLNKLITNIAYDKAIGSFFSDSKNKIQALAGPALLGLDFLLHGQPTLPGVFSAGLATLASTKTAAEYYARFSNWLKAKWSGDGKSNSEDTLALGFMTHSDAQSDSFAEDREQESEEFEEVFFNEGAASSPNFKSDSHQSKSSFTLAFGGGLAALLSPDIANAATDAATQHSSWGILGGLLSGLGVFFLGMTLQGKDRSGAEEYSSTFNIQTPALGIPKKIHFEGKEWEGVVERLEWIEHQIGFLPTGQKLGQQWHVRRSLHELLWEKEEYSAEQFKIILEGFEKTLEEGLVYSRAIQFANLTRSHLEKISGLKIEQNKWSEHIRALSQGLRLESGNSNGSRFDGWKDFYGKLAHLSDLLAGADLPSQEKTRAYESLLECLCLPSSEAPLEKLAVIKQVFHSSQELREIKQRNPRLVWNPFAFKHREKLVLHPSLGEGFILEDLEDRLKVKFMGQTDAVVISKASVISPSDLERWQEIVHQRIDRVRHLPYLITPMVIKWLIDDQDMLPLKNSSSIISRSFAAIKASATKSNPKHQKQLQEDLAALQLELGIDPINFVFRMLVGERPSALIYPGKKPDYSKLLIDRLLTPDLVREFLLTQPWRKAWKEAGATLQTEVVKSIGFYFPQYYRGKEKPSDLTELYFAFREGDPAAFQEVTELFRDPIQNWATDPLRKGEAVLLPMIGTAPLEPLAQQYGLPVMNPWLPRPSNYGEGVEGLNANQKWKKVEAVLKINPQQLDSLKGKSVLILDDNLTDGITYLLARRLLLKAGVAEVRLLTLTKTLRDPRELEWEGKRLDSQNHVTQGGAPLLAAVGAGLAALLSPDIVNAASDVESAIVTQGFWPVLVASLGLGTLGILGMAVSDGEKKKKFPRTRTYDFRIQR